MLDFKELSFQDKELIESYLYSFGEDSCQHSFTQKYLLKDKYHDLFCEEDGILYILRSGLCTEGLRVYLFPFCKEELLPRALKIIASDAASYDSALRFFPITGHSCDFLEKYMPGSFKIEESRDYAEYIYTSEKLAFLKGRKMAQKRNHINTFNRSYEGRFCVHHFGCEDTEEEHRIIKDVLCFQAEWLSAREKQDLYEELLAEDFHISTALKHRHRLNICGIALYVDGDLAGYTFGNPISEDCVDVIAEKGNINIGGVYQVLNNEFARMAQTRFTYINREEDLGVAGLRKAKLSYKPDILLEKYIATKKE